MSESKIDPKKTALLLLDLQPGILGRIPEEQASSVLSAAKTAVDSARKAGAHVAYIRVALDGDDFTGVPDHNPVLGAMKNNEQMRPFFHPDHPATQVHDSIKPQAGDMQHRKVRFGSFMRGPSNQLLEDFKAKGIETIVLGGVVTGGAVLSAVRQLADLDFRLVLVEDICADPEEEIHNVLITKVFPKQATVMKAADLTGLFA